jgi:hypothetical protein
MVKLKAFSKFENTTEALAAATALVDSKLSKRECHFSCAMQCTSSACTHPATHWPHRSPEEIFEEECGG